MKQQLRQHIVILSTLLGLSDKETDAGIKNCEAALERRGLGKKAGNPEIKTLAKQVDKPLLEQVLEATKKVSITTPTWVKHIYPLLLEADPKMELTKWQCARLLTELSETTDLVFKTKDRGQNAFTFAEQAVTSMKNTAYTPPPPMKLEQTETLDLPTGTTLTLPENESDETIHAKLRLQQANFYLADIEEKGTESHYFKGQAEIQKTKTEALKLLNKNN